MEIEPKYKLGHQHLLKWCKCINMLIVLVWDLKSVCVIRERPFDWLWIGSGLRKISEGREWYYLNVATQRASTQVGTNSAHCSDFPAWERQEAQPQAMQELCRHVYYFITSTRFENITNEHDLQVGEQTKTCFSWAALHCLGRAGEEVIGSYQLLYQACKVTCSDRASFHIYLGKQIPFQVFS